MIAVIGEKPSVARDIARILGASEKQDGYLSGNGYLVTWAFGHLVGLAMPEAYGIQSFRRESLPIIPDSFQLTPRQVKAEKGYKADPGALKQLKVIKEVFDQSDKIIVATDAGREGELIFRYIYQYIGCNKPFVRLWISSLTDKAIREGLQNLKNGSLYDNLFLSAQARSEADYLIGINGTQALSVAAGQGIFSLGRVQSPTLAMICTRFLENKNFVPQKYWQLKLQSAKDNIAFTALSADKYDMQQAAIDTLQRIKEAKTVQVKTVERKEVNQESPLLYDLTTLQKEANAKLNFSADKTLSIAQKLYEGKIISYPRTGSRYISQDVFEEIPERLVNLEQYARFAGYAAGMKGKALNSRSVNDGKVTDHHAIIPTMELAKSDLAALPESERNILILAGARLLFAAAEPHIYEAVTAVFSCADNDFTAKGKTVLCSGWKDLERRYRLTLKAKPDHEDDTFPNVPDFTEGQTFSNIPATVTAHDTQPPKPHTEASLLSAMEHAGSEDTTEDAERKGLGTPATRAAVIEKLVKSGFVERRGKQLVPTKNGINLVCVLPDSLTSPKLTAEWENTLTLIAKGKSDPEDFMQGIEEMARELVKAYPFLSDGDRERFKEEKPIIGNCPRCGSFVYEGRKNYYCENRDCTFAMWKNDRFFEERKTSFTPKIAAALLKSGKANVKGLYSPKTGKTYDGTVVLADTGGKYVNYRIEITKKK